MAKLIQAIQALTPRIRLRKAASRNLFMSIVTQGSTLSSGVVTNVHESEMSAVANLLLEGMPVHTDMVIFTPYLDLNGRLEIKVRAEAGFRHFIHGRGEFRGQVLNAENIGKSSADLVSQWNELHPEDPIV
jgi:hypothetical protein